MNLLLLYRIKCLPKNTNGRLAIPALAGLLVSQVAPRLSSGPVKAQNVSCNAGMCLLWVKWCSLNNVEVKPPKIKILIHKGLSSLNDNNSNSYSLDTTESTAAKFYGVAIRTMNASWWMGSHFPQQIQDGGRRPSWITENINNYELDRAILHLVVRCTTAIRRCKHGQKSKPEVNLLDVIE